jgi:hypothetical protein
LLKKLIEPSESRFVILESKGLHALHMFPHDGSEMAPEARKAAKTLQNGIRIGTYQGTNNRGRGLPPARSTQIAEGVSREIAVRNEPIEK